MKEVNKIDKLVTVIRSEIDYIKKYEGFFIDYNKSLEKLNKDFATRALDEDIEDAEIVDYCLKTYSLKALYNKDIKSLYTKVVDYYKALVIIDSKNLLSKDEINLIESVNSKLEKVSFVINEKGELVEKVKGYVDSIKDNIKNSGQLEIILESFRKSYKNSNG